MSSNPQVRLTTTYGEILLELNAEKAPITVKNFLSYVESGHYNNTIFHRVINNFMIQGGGFDLDFSQKPTQENIQNEANNGLTNDEGTIAMARTPDPHSASAQFFINVNNNDFLNFRDESMQGWGYAVFGKVVEGMETVNKIKEVATGGRNGHQDVPVEDVILEKAELVK